MKRLLSTAAPAAISLFGAAIFLDSLRYKFTDHPKTQVIFGKLNDWSTSIGFPGVFAHGGLFSQYTIGSAELVASALLLAGLHPALKRVQGLGGVLAFAIMSGAVSFHLFTPLGVDPNNDGGGLFAAAFVLWLSALALIAIRRNELIALAREIAHAIVPTNPLRTSHAASATPARA